MAKVNFNNLDEAELNGGNNSGNGNDVGFFTLRNDNDEAIVRFMCDSTDDFEILTVHDVQIGTKYRKVNCIRDPREPLDNCPLCKNKGFIAKLTEHGGMYSHCFVDCKCVEIRNSIMRMKRSGLKDIIKELEKPGRDIRDSLTAPILRDRVIEIQDLEPGMIMKGTVRNVIDFGAFVDIGVHQDGLVHISEISDKYIKHPSEVLSVGDAAFKEKSEQRILDMMADGVTVLFVSHSTQQVLNICNKAIILDHGKLIASGDAKEICAQYDEMVKGGK